MWCTTECWDCEDKTCEHYVSKRDLYFENKELKKELEKYKSRNEKAIYYIWKEIEQEYDEENNKWLKEKTDNLSNILKGSDEE